MLVDGVFINPGGAAIHESLVARVAIRSRIAVVGTLRVAIRLRMATHGGMLKIIKLGGRMVMPWWDRQVHVTGAITGPVAEPARSTPGDPGRSDCLVTLIPEDLSETMLS